MHNKTFFLELFYNFDFQKRKQQQKYFTELSRTKACKGILVYYKKKFIIARNNGQQVTLGYVLNKS